jgi:hypothetical protein
MGQYYIAVILEAARGAGQPEVIRHYMLIHGHKMMEHAYLGNMNLIIFELQLLALKTPQRIVWAGDYANSEPDGDTIYHKCFLMEDGGEDGNDSELLAEGKVKLIEKKPETILYGHLVEFELHPYIVNHTKKQYVDKNAIPPNEFGEYFHPLPLLTCEGNGAGGGDFMEDDPEDLVGSWARDYISLESSVDHLKSEGFTEVIFDVGTPAGRARLAAQRSSMGEERPQPIETD